MKALILAGGQGLRLRSVVKNIPKPMARVAGKPFLEYLIQQLTYYNIREIVLAVGYQAQIIQDYFLDGANWGVHITYSVEDQPLGTGGAIKKASGHLGLERFLVLNGDSFFDLDIAALLDVQKTKQAIGVFGLTYVYHADRYGVVQLGDGRRIVGFTEKQYVEKGMINGGIYVFGPEIFAFIPADRQVSLEQDVLPNLLGENLFGELSSGFFIDIGIPEDYLSIKNHPEKITKLRCQ